MWSSFCSTYAPYLNVPERFVIILYFKGSGVRTWWMTGAFLGEACMFSLCIYVFLLYALVSSHKSKTYRLIQLANRA